MNSRGHGEHTAEGVFLLSSRKKGIADFKRGGEGVGGDGRSEILKSQTEDDQVEIIYSVQLNDRSVTA